MIVTFNLVCFAWIFFRARSMSDAVYVAANLVDGLTGTGKFLIKSNGRINFIVLLVLALTAVAANVSINRKSLCKYYESCRTFRYLVYNLLVLSIIFLATNTSKAKFLYFQF